MRLRRSPADAVASPALPVLDAVPTPRASGRARLGDLLVRRDAVAAADMREALGLQSDRGLRLGELLVELGVVTEDDVAAALAEQAGLDVVDLNPESSDPEALAGLPESLARSLLAVPLRRTEAGELVVPVADPAPGTIEQLRAAAGVDLVIRVAPLGQVRRRLDAVYRALAGVADQVEAFSGRLGVHAAARRTDLDGDGDDAPVVRIVTMILTQALRDRASDVHLEPQDGRVRVRYRIDGALHDVLALPSDIGPALTSRIKIMAGMNIVERRRPQDGQLAIEIDGRAVDVRVATVGVHWGEKTVLRVLDKSRSLFKLGDLGMPPDTHEAFSRLIRAPFGMVICAGPTGSGKTTTLYASLSEMNDSARNIMTIEDPVEYVFPSINQIQTNEAAGLTFATGLKSILRQDPDVILVGESRDVDTARIAVQSALTGDFVLSSLHATDAVAALHRFLDMGIESFLIASSVLAVVGQRLVRRTCDSCKAPYKPSDEEMAFYNEL